MKYQKISDEEIEARKQAFPPALIISMFTGLEIPTGKNIVISSPLRDDFRPSLSFYNQGEAFKDHGTGEGGGSVEAVGYCLGLTDKKEIFKRWLEITGGTGSETFSPILRSKPTSVTPKPSGPQKPFIFYKSSDGCRALSEQRHISQEALLWAQEVGCLWFGEDKRLGQHIKDCYFISNQAQSFFIARRIDGGMLPTQNGSAKSVSLYGSKGRTIGTEFFVPSRKDPIVFVEGEVDFLSAVDTCQRIVTMATQLWSPYAALGASTTLPQEDLEVLGGRQVVIIADSGNAGEDAARRWARQLVGYDCAVDIIKAADIATILEEPKIKDLNDIYKYAPGYIPELINQIKIKR